MCYVDDFDYESDYDTDYDDSDYENDYDTDYDDSSYGNDYDESNFDESIEGPEDTDDSTSVVEESIDFDENYETDDGDEVVEDIDDTTDEVEESANSVENFETDNIDETVEDAEDNNANEIEESTDSDENYETDDGNEVVEDIDDTTDEVEESANTVAGNVADERDKIVESLDEPAEHNKSISNINVEQLDEKNNLDYKSNVENAAKLELATINETICNAIEDIFVNESADYIEVLETRLEHSDPDVAELFLEYFDLIDVADTFYMGTAHFNPNDGEIYLNTSLDEVNPRGAGTTFYHEAAHAIDIQNNEASLNDGFEAAIRSDVEAYIANYAHEHSLSREGAVDEISMTVLAGHENHSISDIFGGVTGGECQGDYGHMPQYWDNPGMLAKETFAHFTEAAMGCPEKYEMLSKMLPTAFDEYKIIVEELKK